MPRRQKVDEQVVLNLYQEVGVAREVARRLAIHEGTVYGILKRNRGICVRCPKSVQPGKKYCPKCLEFLAERQSEKRKNRKLEGKCLECDKPICVSSRVFCEEHWQKDKARSRTQPKRNKYGAPNSGIPAPIDRARRLRNTYGPGGVAAWEASQGCCTMCGISYEERAIHIHHIDCNKKNNDPTNFVTLCFNCHRLTHLLIEHPNPDLAIQWIRTTYPGIKI